MRLRRRSPSKATILLGAGIDDTRSAMSTEPNRETATLAGGCFWCLEAVFKELRGVERVESGYAGQAVVAPKAGKFRKRFIERR